MMIMGYYDNKNIDHIVNLQKEIELKINFMINWN